MRKNLPDFIFIGPDKSGSTWLYEQCLAHPLIYVPDAKDLYFFDKNYYKGLNWYNSFFLNSDSCFKGEISHDYIFSQSAIQRISKHCPHVKIMTILRNPLDKIWSHYLFLKRSGATKLSFEDALFEFPELISKAKYYSGLKSVYNYFPKDQIGIFYFDELELSPSELILKIFSFLEVEHNLNVSVTDNPLPASQPRSYYLAKAVKQMALLLRRLHLENLLGLIKRNKLIKNLLYKSYKNKPLMCKDTKSRLYQDHFKEEVDNLEALLKVDLSAWR